MLLKVLEVAPSLYPMTWQAYAKPTKLFYGDDFLLSRDGLQQGDVLGPLYFSLAIQEMANGSQSDYSSWYLDDGVLASRSQTVKEDYLRIVEVAASLGLRVKPSKCEISAMKPDNVSAVQSLTSLEPLLKVIDVGDLQLLGAPLLPSSVEPVLRKKLDELKRMAENLKLLDNHVAFFLLKNCFAIPRLQYFLRCAPCFTRPDLLGQYDAVIYDSLQAILNVSLDQRSCAIATLPVALGGLGVRTASDLALPGFISSSYGSASVVSTLLPESTMEKDDSFIAAAVAEWKKMVKLPDNGQEPGDKSAQESWDMPICKMKFQNLLDSGNAEEKSILLHIIRGCLLLGSFCASQLTRTQTGQCKFQNCLGSADWSKDL